MQTGGLNDILKTLLDNDNKGISNQELIRLLQKIENEQQKYIMQNIVFKHGVSRYRNGFFGLFRTRRY